MARLTEAQIRDLFLGFSRDYQNYKSKHYQDRFIWEELHISLQHTLNNPAALYQGLKIKTKC